MASLGSVALDRDTGSTVKLLLLTLDLGVEHVLFERDASTEGVFVQGGDRVQTRSSPTGDIGLVSLLLVGGVVSPLDLDALGARNHLFDTHFD